MSRSFWFSGLLLGALVLVAGCTSPQEVAVITERPTPSTEQETTPAPSPAAEDTAPVVGSTIRPGRFDAGKMWTFDNPPVDYFEEAYGFRPDSIWFAKARLGALRFSTNCSASFVSPMGLVMTNNHCARESITEVSRPGENLADVGFYARSLEEERKVDELYVEQLIAISDVTGSVYRASRPVRGDNEKAQARQNRMEEIEAQMTGLAQAEDSTLRVQVIELYNGGKYAAYTFRRYEDVRLVMAPEHKLGFFGGDPDNFTYPRFALDMSFFRVYDKEGQPLHSDPYFAWSTTGSREGDPVFVVGNPGSTSRWNSVAALEFERDYTAPQELEALRNRGDILKGHLDTLPDDADESGLRNTYLQVSNSLKASEGQLRGLREPALMDRRRAMEEMIRRDLAAVDTLQQQYGGLFQDLEELQIRKQAVVSRMSAFSYFGTALGSRVFTRALYAYYYDTLKRRGFLPPDELAEIREQALDFEDLPVEVEKKLIALRLHEIREAMGTIDPTINRITNGQPVDSVAASLSATSALVDSSKYVAVFDAGYLGSGDSSVEVIEALAPLYFLTIQEQQGLDNREELLNAQLARARFALYGTSVPPDASFSPRIADGVIKGYSYNGTVAPAYTTFYGLYNHYYSYGKDSDWDLPERWLTPPESFDLSTPLNLVSTNDITGGNSGSPLLNKNLEIVGLIFDGNIESLPNHYLYRDETARTVSVDARGILEALDEMYDADRIVLELTTGRMVTSEEEADAARGTR
ncbi:MAG: S46 family peptidase [Rhodothermales bacterium]